MRDFTIHQKDRSNNLKPKYILGLIGSPRKLGNCEIFVKEISRNIHIDHTLTLIRMPSLSILPCNACYCCIVDNPCPNIDDMDMFLTSIEKADAIIVASPVYFLGTHSIFKRILDRGFLFYRFLKKTYGKPCILINIHGVRERVGISPQTLMTFASFLGLTIKASINLKAALPGDVLKDSKNSELAKRLAELLFSSKKIKRKNGCPFCGCEIVRMKKTKFICTLCHGTFVIDEKGKRLKIEDGGILGTPDYMMLHKEWLKNMKNKFLKERKGTLKMIAPLKDIGKWVKE
jgi:multimeric flavodoxin WrbA